MTMNNHIERVPDAEPIRVRKPAFGRVMRSLIGFVTFVGLALAGVLFWVWTLFTAPGPLTESKILNIPEGIGRQQLAVLLEKERVINDARILSGASILAGLRGSTLKPGEYEFPANASAGEVLNMIISGRVLTHKLTIPEGWTTHQAIARINENDVLSGDKLDPASFPEGSIVADTHVFPRGTDRKKLAMAMQAHQSKLLDEAWSRRPANFILKSKEELLTLASIVEKETGKPEERARVAAVFLNRLKKGMRLQSDPTIIYGITLGKEKLDRPLTRADIEQKTAYNTYQIDGLPPGPIASPGSAALEAVIAPMQTEDLYFVADGTGGHAFAVTLEQHNANVQKWREFQKAGILLPGENAPAQDSNTTVQTELPDVVQPAPEAAATAEVTTEQPAVNDAAIAEAATDASKVQAVPQPEEAAATNQAGTAEPVPVAPPPLPVAKKPRPESATEGTVEVVLKEPKPGTVIKVGERMLPIPAMKKKKSN